MTQITKYFFICNIKEEECRYLSVKKQMNNYNINNYESKILKDENDNIHSDIIQEVVEEIIKNVINN